MNLNIQLKPKCYTKRKPCREINLDLQDITSTACSTKSRMTKPSTAYQTIVNSINNSCSISPRTSAIPLELVSPCSVNISKILQEKLKSRHSSKTNSIDKEPTVFFRAVAWKNNNHSKITRLRKEKEKSEMIECTFTPKVNKYIEKSRDKSMRPATKRLLTFRRHPSNNESRYSCENSEATRTYEEITKDEAIEKSFIRITSTLDTISKQILESIANSHTRENCK